MIAKGKIMDNTQAFNALLNTYRDNADNTRQQGDCFEHLTKIFLEHDATYKAIFKHVYFWGDWAKDNNQKVQDTGIDLIGERYDGGICAIQCKFYDARTAIQKSDIDSFLSLSSKDIFTHRLFVDTTAVPWGGNAEDAIKNQNPTVEKLGITDFTDSNIDWEHYLNTKQVQHTKKTLRPHQKTVLKKTAEYYKTHSRGKLIMACGTGKTFTSLRIAEQQAGAGKTVLYLVPSLALMAQTIREWFYDCEIGINAISVCSDTKVSTAHRNNDTVDISTNTIPITVTTESTKVSQWAEQIKNDKMNVVFATYQSIQVLSDAQNTHAMDAFDLVICDEAHRTTGVTLHDKAESHFVKVHDEDYIQAKKRLYMTATPKVYTDNVKIKAKKADAELSDMGDISKFGETIHTISFDYAVENNLLTDYKVLVLALLESAVDKEFQELLADADNDLGIEYTTKLVGCYKALCKTDVQDDKITDKNPMRRGVAFAKDIKLSKDITKQFPNIAKAYKDRVNDSTQTPLDIEMDHIDGTFDADNRKKCLSWLQDDTDDTICRILSNARCLSEGVDVPTLDAVMFLHPRKSEVDVVQAVGRVMRKAPNKKMGYIILPVTIPAGMNPSKALDNNERYKVVWQVLNALRSHDERLEGKINRMGLGGDIKDKIEIICKSDIFPSTKTPSPNKKSADTQNTDSLDGTAPDTDPPTAPEQSAFAWQDAVLQAIRAKLVDKCGTREYWEDWAKDIADIAKTHIARIKNKIDTHADAKSHFDAFLHEMRDDLNPNISENDAIELLAQHLITKPVFDALFDGYAFTKNNPVSVAISTVLDSIQSASLDAENESLYGFYNSVKRRVADTKTVDERQQLIIRLYDKFFKTAFPKATQQLGIVYTPTQVVDFIIHSINDILRDEFDTEIGANGVNILDPFTGTGTFVTRLLQSGLIKPQQLEYKYKHEIHANEIVLLAYYIASINIEQVYTDIMGKNGHPLKTAPFEGICLTDTFQMYESEDMIQKLMPDNSERRKKQKNLDIRVIMGNPPYSAGQKSANDNAQNMVYPDLDKRIEQSYVKHSTATNKNALYDSYIRAIRWGSDRLGDCGVMGYITNGGFIESNSMGGLRKCLQDEYTNLYVFNLRGNIRKNMKNKSSGEGGNVFDVQVPVAITLFVKNKNAQKIGNVYYYDIGDNLDKRQKLHRIKALKSIDGIRRTTGFDTIIPDKHNDWINQRDDSFYDHMPMGDKATKGKAETQAIFKNYSRGLATSRDTWVYNNSKTKLINNVKNTIDFYNAECDRYQQSDKTTPIKDFVAYGNTKISWGRQNLKDAERNKPYAFMPQSVMQSAYRPFCKQWVYYHKDLNDMIYQLPKIFPMETHIPNRCICVSGDKFFITDTLPDLHFVGDAQLFPLTLYTPNAGSDLLKSGAGDYIPTHGITDYAHTHFSYADYKPTKNDIFYYIYGVLHHPDYTKKWETNLTKSLPHIPKVKTSDAFKAFAAAGRALAELHIHYESAEPYAVNYRDKNGKPSTVLDPSHELTPEHYTVEKMKFAKSGKDTDKTTIIYNDHITVCDIPLGAYDYMVNAKSPIEWVMDRQSIKTHKDSQITNNANDYAHETLNNPKYPLELLLKSITVSLETQKIIKTLPELDF